VLEHPLLSIVVKSYTLDRRKDIYELMDSIKAQTYRHIETIFIIERSRELYEDIKDYRATIGLRNVLVLLSARRITLGGARNLGSKRARGEIIAFVDDDVVLSPDWASEMVKSYEDKNIIGVTGAALPLWRDTRLDWLPKELYWLISCTEWTDWKGIIEVRSVWGANMSFRREAFEKAGTFLQSLGYHAPMAEDLEFSLRVRAKTGKNLVFNPKAFVWHKVYGYRVGFRFVAARAHHIGVSRRLLKSTYLGRYAPFKIERGMLFNIAKIMLLSPFYLFRDPVVAWKRFFMAGTIVLFAGLGYLFPKGIGEAAKEIEKARVVEC
jgi:GT2 family glycosyltransferase